MPAVAVRRGERVESVHAVAACACDARGRVVLALGATDVPVYLRSAAKPFIAAAVVRAGALERFGFGERELAVMCASHNGESGHVELVASMLERIGASIDDLGCGVQTPSYEAAAAALAARGERPTPLHNNCSGKHAGILALAKLLGAPFAGYLEADHPAQRAVLALCERIGGERFGRGRLAIDGCGIPVYATSLRNAARAFGRLATLEELADADAAALDRVRRAMAAEPWYVAGSEQFDTDLLRATAGRIVGKIGAEGVHGDALLDLGLGLALKTIDGNARAVPPAAIGLLEALGGLGPAARAALEPHARPPLRNRAGRIVGALGALEGWIAGAAP